MSQSPEIPLPTIPLPTTRLDRLIASLRRLLNAVVIFVIAFTFLREFALEPYGVPTGSMATAFLGNHRECPCPRCGFPVVVGVHGPVEAQRRTHAACPNCGCRPISLANTLELPGDRLMVDKNIFNLRSPRRWEVCVFRCPVDDARPYVKRVVGLPGEAIQIKEGDVYADGILQRKSRRECRECRVLVFDHGHAPSTGWGPRWRVETLAEGPRGAAAAEAGAEVLRDGAIVLDATRPESPALGLTYRHWNLDAAREESLTDELGYNSGSAARGVQQVHDFAVEFELTVQGRAGSVALRLFDGADSVYVQMPVSISQPSISEPSMAEPGMPKPNIAEPNIAQASMAEPRIAQPNMAEPRMAEPSMAKMNRAGASRSEVIKSERHATELGRDGAGPVLTYDFCLEPGRVYRVEFALIDRRAWLAVNGRLAGPPLDLPAEPVEQRGGVSRPFQMGVRGVAARLQGFRLYRDVHYRSEGSHGTHSPWKLAADQYFVLGDNSTSSNDSREWASPGVPERSFIGKPFLIHQPLRLGQVNVGGTPRFYQTIDWSRLRWVR